MATEQTFPAERRSRRFQTHIEPALIDRLKALVLAARHIVITCHVSPDGDALGSSCAMKAVLTALGKDVDVVTADCAPRSLQFLPGVRDIVAATRQPDTAALMIARADLIICLDFNDLKRVDRLEKAIASSGARRVVIDHHLDPSIDAEVIISHPEVSSTSALLYIVLWQAYWAKYLNRSSAACIYTGMMTDTGNFSYNSNDPDLYLIIHDLLLKGIDKDNLYKLVMNTSSESRIRITGFGQYRMQLLKPHRAALILLSADELEEFGYSKGDTEGLVNVPLAIPDVIYSVFMREDGPDMVKVSMRSKGDFPVNLICEECFGGGGHVNAAGGEFHGSLSDSVTRLLEVLPDYDRFLT